MKLFAEGEVIIGAWSRKVEKSDGVTDAWLKAFMPDESMIDKFANIAEDDLRGKKRDGGKMFFIQIFEIEDPEPQSFSEVEFPEPVEKKSFSQMAAIIGNDDAFPKFAKLIFNDCINLLAASGVWEKPKTGATFKESIERQQRNAASLIRYVCSIDSRSQLDTSQPAAELFNDMIMKPFYKFKEENCL